MRLVLWQHFISLFLSTVFPFHSGRGDGVGGEVSSSPFSFSGRWKEGKLLPRFLFSFDFLHFSLIFLCTAFVFSIDSHFLYTKFQG